MAAETYSSTDTINFPTGPSRTGYYFSGWDHSEQDIKDEIASGARYIVVSPCYEKSTDGLLLTIHYTAVNNQNDIHEPLIISGEQGDPVTVEAPEIDGYLFSCWRDADGALLSTQSQYRIMTVDGNEITAEYVYESESPHEDVPVVALTDAVPIVDDGVNKIEYVATGSMSDEYTTVEIGVIYSTSSKYGENNATETMKRDESGISIGSAELTGQRPAYTYTVQVGSKTDTVVYVRAFMVVKNQNGDLFEIYSDNIYKYSYNMLANN